MMSLFAQGRHAKPSRLRRPVALTAVAAVVLGGGTIAYAAWTANASGSAKANSVTAVTATVSVATGTADLWPGATGKVYFTVTNPNPYPVTFTAADFSTVVSDNETSCPNANITVNDKTGLSINVAGNATSSTQSITGAVTMASSAPDGCQGRTFTITTALSGTSV